MFESVNRRTDAKTNRRTDRRLIDSHSISSPRESSAQLKLKRLDTTFLIFSSSLNRVMRKHAFCN